MIIYPTETIYGLGVNALDERALQLLQKIKGREATKTVSWLVRSISDIETYAKLPQKARIIAEEYMPGPITLVLEVKDIVPKNIYMQREGTAGFRISSDPIAQKLIANYLQKENAPLTCTSANISGQPTLTTPNEILQQFASFNINLKNMAEIIDDGPRTGKPSTVVRVINDTLEIIREGAISKDEIYQTINT